MNKKKFFRFFIFHDWLWSVSLCFLAYWLTNWGPPTLFGVAMTYYAINWLQALMATGGIMAGLAVITRLGLWFYFRVLHRYIYGYEKPQSDTEPEHTHRYFNKSERDFKQDLSSWQRIKIIFAVFFFLFSAALLVFLKLLSAVGG